jgi:hypothetical protein
VKGFVTQKEKKNTTKALFIQGAWAGEQFSACEATAALMKVALFLFTRLENIL